MNCTPKVGQETFGVQFIFSFAFLPELYLRRERYFTWSLVKGQAPLPIRYGV